MKFQLCFALLLCVASALQALETKPPLSFAFPMEERGGRVVTTMPVLASHHDIIPAGAHLHTVYISPAEHEPDANILSLLQKDSRREAAYTRKPQHVDKKSPAQHQYEKSLEAMRRQRWQKIQLFQLAFANLAHKTMRITYTPAGDRKPSESVLDLPNGLLLAEKAGSVVILAVEVGSRAEQAGVKAGEIIRSLNGVPIGSLSAFSKAWSGQSKSNQFSLLKSGGTVHSVTLHSPVSLNTSVFDMP